MEISLKKAAMPDCGQIHEMQLKAFRELLDKYHDYNTNPENVKKSAHPKSERIYPRGSSAAALARVWGEQPHERSQAAAWVS